MNGTKTDTLINDCISGCEEDILYCVCRAFHAEVPGLLRKGGIYSFFNGLAADNAFFHNVCCHVVQAELVRCALIICVQSCGNTRKGPHLS